MKRVVGIFNNEEKAIRAIEGLKAQGYTDGEISVITQNTDTYDAIKTRTGLDLETANDATDGALAGAATGGALGGIGGLLLGLGALAIPGVGPIIAAGPIASALVGALAGGAVGGLAGALVDYGIPEVEAKDYEQRINQGDVMVLVDEGDDVERRNAVYDNFKENDSYNKYNYGAVDELTDNLNVDVDPLNNDNYDRKF